MATKKEIDVWVVVDSDGDYAIASDQETAWDNFDNEIGGALPRRIINRRYLVTLPEIDEAAEDIPDTAGEIVNVEVEKEDEERPTESSYPNG